MFHHRHQIDHHRYEFIFHLVKIHQYKYQIFRTPYANGDAQGQGRVPRHRELDPDKLFRKIYPYVLGEGKQLQDYWDSDVISTAVARNSSLGEGVEHPAPFPEDIVRHRLPEACTFLIHFHWKQTSFFAIFE